MNDEDKEGEGYDKGQLGQEGQGHVQHAQLGVVLGEDLLLPDDGDDEGVANQTQLLPTSDSVFFYQRKLWYTVGLEKQQNSFRHGGSIVPTVESITYQG